MHKERADGVGATVQPLTPESVVLGRRRDASTVGRRRSCIFVRRSDALRSRQNTKFGRSTGASGKCVEDA